MFLEIRVIISLVSAAILGISASFITGLDTDLRARNWASKFFKTSTKLTSKKIIERAKLVAKYQKLIQILVFFPLPLFLIPVLFIGFLMELPNPSILCYFAAFFLPRLSTLPEFLEHPFDFPSKLLPIVNKMVGRHCDKQQAFDFFQQLGTTQDDYQQIAAIMGFSVLPKDQAIKGLNSIKPNSENIEKVLDRQRKYISELQNGIHPDDLIRMEKLIQTIERMNKDGNSFSTPTRTLLYDLKELIEYSHQKYLRAFPDLYCMDCLMFAEKRQFEQCQWVRCPGCLTAHQLTFDYNRVIGQIGGTKTIKSEGKTLLIPLWEAENQKVNVADVHQIEIIANSPINYDWAINSIIEAYRNQNRPTSNIYIKIESKIALEENTVRMIEDFFRIIN